jgi:hypothetical protein
MLLGDRDDASSVHRKGLVVAPAASHLARTWHAATMADLYPGSLGWWAWEDLNLRHLPYQDCFNNQRHVLQT